MKTLNIAEARQNLSALVDEVRFGGETVIIAKYGHPAVRIVRLAPNSEEEGATPGIGRTPSSGDWRDELGLRDNSFSLPKDFDEPMDALWDVFGENEEEPVP
jgi:prevent-host-death family protein